MRKKTKLLYIYDGEDPKGWYAIKISEDSEERFYWFIDQIQADEEFDLFGPPDADGEVFDITLRDDIYPSQVSLLNDHGLPCATNVWRKSIVEFFNRRTTRSRINTKRTIWGQRYAASAMSETMISRVIMNLEKEKSLKDSCAEIVA
jgi:hypothetical protein